MYEYIDSPEGFALMQDVHATVNVIRITAALLAIYFTVCVIASLARLVATAQQKAKGLTR